MFTLNCKGKIYMFDSPIVMGIVNATPDSFYEGSRFTGQDGILSQVQNMIAEGATIIDIGGQSTRPGSNRISADEEMTRVCDAIASIHFNYPEILISVDTYFASVARAAITAGATIVNDISGGTFDAEMVKTVSELKTPFICTHAPGTADTMHARNNYTDVTTEVIDFFIQRLFVCQQAGINDIIIDPGIGFGKDLYQNFEIIRNLEKFSILEKPLLLGVSRKGTIYRTLGTTAEKALNGTTVLNTIALMKGAAILRVHDVKEAMEAIALTRKVL